MYTLLKLASKAPKYIGRFGISAGLRLLFQVEGVWSLPQKSQRTRAFSVPGFIFPIILRDCVGDHATFWQCLVLNQYDFEKYPQASRVLESYSDQLQSGKTPLIIDCGGNIGMSAVWFLTKFPKAKVYVIEPDEENLNVLTRNLAPFSDRVCILDGGISSMGGQMKIVNPDSGPAAYRVEMVKGIVEGGPPITCYTINQVCELAANRDPLIVKLDIEGSQMSLFSSNTDWVNRSDLITLELDDWQFPWQGTSRPFFRCVSQYEFDYILNGESIFCFRDQDNSRVMS